MAGLMLCLVGGFHVIQGVVALVRDDEVFIVTEDRLVTNIDYEHRLHRLGLDPPDHPHPGRRRAVLRTHDRPDPRRGLALQGACVDVAFLPAYPVWSVMMIAIDVLVVWAIIVHGGELRRQKV